MRGVQRSESLCSRIYNSFKKIHDYFFLKTLKIAFIGPKDAGKSSFVSPLFSNTYLTNMNSSEIRCQKNKLNNIKMIIYDVPGGSNFESKWDHYYKKVDVIIFFIDSTSTDEEYLHAKDALKSLLYRNMWLKKNLLILGTKNDLVEAKACRELILNLDLMSIVDREVACYSVSSKNVSNVDLVRDWLIDQAQLPQESAK